MGEYVGLVGQRVREASCQTDEFLLYLTLEQQLSHIYLQYRRLQAELAQTHTRLIQEQANTLFLTHSLRETTAIFLSHSQTQTHTHNNALRQLDQQIHQEQLELDILNAPPIPPPKTDRTYKQINIKTAIPSQRAIAVQKERSSSLQKLKPKRKVLGEISINSQPEIEGYAKVKEKEREKQQRKETRLTLGSNRYSKHFSSVRQDENNGYSSRQPEAKTAREKPHLKEGDCQQMLERMEAELKYKEFMSQFGSGAGSWRS